MANDDAHITAQPTLQLSGTSEKQFTYYLHSNCKRIIKKNMIYLRVNFRNSFNFTVAPKGTVVTER